MATFEAQTMVDPNPGVNALYNAQQGQWIQNQTAQQTLQQRNQLFPTELQSAQQKVGAADQEQVGRLSAALLNVADPDQRAQLYSRGVGLLQSQGYAKNAPATMPDDATLHMLATMGTPSQTQAEWAQNIAANKAYTNATNPPATAPSATPGAAATSAGTATIGQRQNNPGNLTFAGQPNATPGQGNRFAAFPDMPTGVAANADQLALYATQHGVNTVRDAVTRWVGDPKADLGSYIGDISKALGVGPDDKIDLTDPAVQAKFIQAQFPHESAGGGYVLNPADVAKGVQIAAARRGQIVQPTPTATAQGAPGGGGQPPPAPTQFAGPGAPPGSTAAPGGPAPLPVPGAGGAPQNPLAPPAPQQPQVAPAPTSGAPAQPGQPPAATPGQPPPAPAPAGGPQPPQLPPLNNNGLTPQQQAQINAVASTGRMTVEQRMAAEQGFRNQNIQLAQKAFSDYVQTQQLAVSQGQLSNAQAETNLKYWQANHPELAPNARVNTLAYRTLQELAPIVRAGNAPQDVIDRYNNAANEYQEFKEAQDPISKQLVQVPTKPLPEGFPRPTAGPGATAPGGARPLTQGLSPQQQQVERDPAAYKVNETNYGNDATDIRGIAAAGRQAQADQIRIKEMQDVLQGFSTGPGTEARTAASAWLQRWLPSALTGWEKESPNLSGSDAAQAFSKLALASAGSQEQSVLGTRGGYQAIKLFKDANPNVNLQDATNKSILDMQLINNQANQDYAQAAQAHFRQNENTFKTTHDYNSLNDFDADWNAQRNPQVYSAAMGAVTGQPASQWTKGLTDDEYARALQIVQRAKPSAVVQTKNGPYSMQPAAVTSGTSGKPGTTVIRFDHNGNVIPGP